MTDTRTAAELLQAAADKLRALATATTPGPWIADASIPYGHRVGSVNDADWITWTGEYGETGSDSDAAYIAAMHPLVGLAVADWLEREARQERYTLAEFGHRSASNEAKAAARVVLGEEAQR
jgi:hypothetical protein